jgi:adenosyl cobinamide kinase/adenosyl cobinamide phosphate guanylyltransferase
LDNDSSITKKETPITSAGSDDDGKLIMITNDAGQSVVKYGHLKRLVRRLVDPNSYG